MAAAATETSELMRFQFNLEADWRCQRGGSQRHPIIVRTTDVVAWIVVVVVVVS